MTMVGVISDTHGYLSPEAYAALADCDYIIHAGDIGGMAIVRELETLAPVVAVLGNNDAPSDYPSSIGRFARPVIDGVHFLVAHYPRDVRINFAGSSALSPGDPIPEVCIHGHTHAPKLEWGKAAYPAHYLLNPGTTTRPRSGSPRTLARILIEEGRVTGMRVETFWGSPVLSMGTLGE